ncbi:MAG: Fic family protein [Elusimicrobia bacterium]|nr:Fic family protein [Elusimicrobiota bacterium]
MRLLRPSPLGPWAAAVLVAALAAGHAGAEALLLPPPGPAEAPASVAPCAAGPSPVGEDALRARYLAIMEAGSLRLSRTVVAGRRFMAPAQTEDVSRVAADNFRAAARWVLGAARALPLGRDTVVQVNRLVTRGLVPEPLRGDAAFNGDASDFLAWLESPQARELAAADPVALAELVHHDLSALDAFPDGNGRTARLAADYVLLRAGCAPALYTELEDYFARGNSRAEASRETQIAYFREAVARGKETAERAPRTRSRDLRRGPPAAELLERIARQDGHRGLGQGPWAGDEDREGEK